MTTGHVLYRSGYKYQLAEDYEQDISVKPDRDAVTEFVTLKKTGQLFVKKGYAWDGNSGPVLDDSENIRASLVHDALYQLMRYKKLTPRKTRKEQVDKLFRKMLKDDGMSSIGATLYYEAVKRLGKPATDPANIKEIKRAPE